MITKEAVINNQVGLHARPATFFIQKANEFKSSIWIEKDERRVNAKSLLGVLVARYREGLDGHPRGGRRRRAGSDRYPDRTDQFRFFRVIPTT